MLKLNKNLTYLENSWLSKMLEKEDELNRQLKLQILHSKVDREYTKFYLILKFHVQQIIPLIKTNVRVPVEMYLKQDGRPPIVFFLHVLNGYVHELEVFNADSSEINSHIDLNKGSVEVIQNISNKK